MSTRHSHNPHSEFLARLWELFEADGRNVGRPYLVTLFEHQEFF